MWDSLWCSVAATCARSGIVQIWAGPRHASMHVVMAWSDLTAQDGQTNRRDSRVGGLVCGLVFMQSPPSDCSIQANWVRSVTK